MPHFQRLPRTLYRIQPKLPVALRALSEQQLKGRSSFDLKLHEADQLVHPVPVGSAFQGPNGMSLRPAGENLDRILREFRGAPLIYRLHEGLLLPPQLILFHEHTDHYSLQAAQPMPLPQLNDHLTRLLQALPPPMTREQFFAAQQDEDDQDN